MCHGGPEDAEDENFGGEEEDHYESVEEVICGGYDNNNMADDHVYNQQQQQQHSLTKNKPKFDYDEGVTEVSECLRTTKILFTF